ncbi:phosphoenolpyruvate carboxylase kinase [Stylonychia lemnae]|uniref:Phosphoenolpyruvate carboxylase kinase n=1 Tax=Stylonychia lemnae TaxID=5949 RepID=A0A078AU17_STYLE|nr:phosphoenolpyruvate carboxylase kinase [Stylonychia lemnae]|eukprot:CDW85895.1 phosphoenolpyruvate carboxylase kinase [Stylonychia lemnae]
MEKYVALSVQPLWDKYQFEANIDSGGFGQVCKVKSTLDNQFYAMKTQNLKSLMTRVPNNYSTEMIRIFREINTFKLNHQNITKFYESYFTFDDQFVIVTELAESNLRTHRENNDLNNDQIADIMIQIMKGTIHLHSKNIMHRDLSPDNILVFENGTKFKICDFGFAQMNSQSTSFVGKPFFQAPEVNINEQFYYSSQVDVWSAGVILYYLCTNQYKYQDQIISEIKKQDQTKVINIEGDQNVFENVLNQMLKLDPSDRLDSHQILQTLCDIKQESLLKHLEMEEEKVNNEIESYAFALTIKSKLTQVNEILAKLGECNFGPIHPNPNRIFMPLIQDNKGDQYQGEYDNITKKKDGRGRQVTFQGDILEGLWKNNLLDGQGRVILKNGDCQMGEYKGNLPTGYGKFYWISGEFYEGQFDDSLRHGYGYFKNKDGHEFYGQFVKDLQEGAAVSTLVNGDINLGQWIKGKKQGIQILIPKDGGKIKINKFKDNVLIETLLEVDNDQKDLQCDDL